MARKKSRARRRAARAASPASALLSLCVIAKDEEALLPGCLDSVASLADQLLVLDTGSSDGTARVARAHGARVHRFTWRDDFAAARNAVLAHARGRWVLVLDADERLAPAALPVIRAALREGGFDLGLLPLHDAASLEATAEQVLSGAQLRREPVLLPRLFRRTRDLAWEGVVHESPRRWMCAPGRRSRVLQAPIIHYGEVASLRQSRDKSARNLELLRRRCAAATEDLHARTYLAEELFKLGRLDEAWEESQLAWAMAQGAAQGRPSGLARVAGLRMLLLVQRERCAEALETYACCKHDARHPNLAFFAAISMEAVALRSDDPQRQGELLRQARALLRFCREQQGGLFLVPPIGGVTSWWAASRLGQVLLQLGEPQQALLAFEDALRCRPGLLEAGLGRAEALLDCGRIREALLVLEPLLQEGGADASLLVAQACHDLGDAAQERFFLERAYRSARKDLKAPFRLARLNALISASRDRAP